MECSEVRVKLDEYINSRLNSDTSHKISYHLDSCCKCFEELNILKEINDMLKMDVSVYPNTSFTMDVMAMIDNERVVRKESFFSRFPIINLGASLILTGLLTIFINTPMINETITRCTNDMVNGAASINTSINMTSGQIHSYITDIIDLGGK